MSTYIRAVVAADAIAEKYGIPLGDLVDTFADIPAADVAPVVRCKDCRWRGREDGRGRGMRIPKPRRLVPRAPQRKIIFSIFAKNQAR